MTPEQIFDIARLSIFTLLYITTPLMLIALGVGLIIALLQALTSIQEITLTFVPKILIVFLALIFLLPMMADDMNAMAQVLYSRIAESGLGANSIGDQP